MTTAPTQQRFDNVADIAILRLTLCLLGHFQSNQEQARREGSALLRASAQSPRVNLLSKRPEEHHVADSKSCSISEEEMFKVIGTGKKTHQKSWKRFVMNPSFGSAAPN